MQEARSLVRLGGLACLAWGGDAMQLKSGRLSSRVWPQENWLRRYLRFLWGGSPQPTTRLSTPTQQEPQPFYTESGVKSYPPLQLWWEGRKVGRIFAQNRIQRATKPAMRAHPAPSADGYPDRI
ncbi:MAG: hypothetical protein Q6K80_05685 [Thermostichus sp. DG_1_6_bins_120]